MKASMVAILAIGALLVPSGGPGSPVDASDLSSSLSVNSANTFCRVHPVGRQRIRFHGWFLPVAGETYVDGGLFQSRRAFPLVTVNERDANGNWRRYGAIYLRIRTRGLDKARSLTVHGTLGCRSTRLVTDRYPFAPPTLTTTYGTPVVEASGAITTWAMSGGLKLTLTVPDRAYPRNALARVRVTLRNVTNHTVGYWSTGVAPIGYTAPQVEVLNAAGKVVFPPAMPYMPAFPGPPPKLEPLRPGQTVGMSEYIVVRGARIRATQSFLLHMTDNIGLPARVLTTRAIRLRLRSESAPAVSLGGTAANPVLDVTRPPNVTGPMLQVSYTDCGFPSTSSLYSYSSEWTVSSLHLMPGCSPVEGWYVRVAWLNHPVAALDYIPPQLTPTTLPMPSAMAAALDAHLNAVDLRSEPSL